MFHRIILLATVALAVLVIAPMSGCYYSDYYGYDDYAYGGGAPPGYYDAGVVGPSRSIYYENRAYRPRYNVPRLYGSAEEGREYREDGRESYGENYRERHEDYREGPRQSKREDRNENATGGKEEEEEEEG